MVGGLLIVGSIPGGGLDDVLKLSGDLALWRTGSLTLMDRIEFGGMAGAVETTGTLRGMKAGGGIVADTREGVDKDRMLSPGGSWVTGG